MNVLWSTVGYEFTPDGSLRDIYIFSTTVSDWQNVLAFIHEHSTELSYTVDDIPAPWPASASEAFALRAHASPRLGFRFGSIEFAAHFFTECEVEFDFRPSDVRNQGELECLLSFLRRIGDLLAKPVSVTPENCAEGAFIVYQPVSQEFRCLPPLSRSEHPHDTLRP